MTGSNPNEPPIRRLKRPSGEREVTYQLTAGRRCYAGTALEASDFPEPIAKSQAAPLTAERKLKKQDPWQVGPVETRLAITPNPHCGHVIHPYPTRNRPPQRKAPKG